MQVNLDQIDFYQPSAPAFSLSSYKKSNSQRLSTLALPMIQAPPAPVGQGEQSKLQNRVPVFQDVIEIPDDDESNDDGATRTSFTPGPDRQVVIAGADGPLSPRMAFSFVRELNLDLDFDHQGVEDSPQPRETPRDDSELAGHHDLAMKPGARHPPSLSIEHLVLVSDQSAFDDDQGIEPAQNPYKPVPSAGIDPVHRLPRQSDLQCHSLVHTAQVNSLEPDVAGQERRRVPSCPDIEASNQILDGAAEEEATRPAVAVNVKEGTPMLTSPPPPVSLLSRLSPSMPAGSQSAQPEPQGTIYARGDANSLDTAGNSSHVSEDPATDTRPLPCDDGSVPQPFTTPRLQAQRNDLLSPPKLKHTQRAYPAKNNAQRQSSRLRAASQNAARVFSLRESDRYSEFDDGSSSEDGSGSDGSYTVRSADGAGEADDGSMDEDDTPAPKRRKQSSPRATAARRRTPGHSSWLSAASTSGSDLDSARTRGIASPPSSCHSSDRGSVAEGPIARFEEWPLQDVVLKRVTENGVAVFQLQFSWDPRTDRPRDHHHSKPRGPARPIRKRDAKKQASSSGAPFTDHEDRCLIRLKEQGGLPWTEIHKSFTHSFPGRTQGALQVRYCTKLKGKSGNQENVGSGQRTSLGRLREDGIGTG